jgi:RNA polymerase sigma-70 factor (ECF subfamily)
MSPSELLTANVLSAVRAGNEGAWAVVYRDIAPRLSGYLRGMQAADVDDVVGDTFVKMLRSIESFDGNADDLRAWAYAIARNTRLDLHRRHARESERAVAVASSVATAGHLSNSEERTVDHPVLERDRIARLLGTLTEKQREVMLLRIVGDLTLQQSAYVLGENVDAVKQLQRRAISQLRELLTAEGFAQAAGSNS